MIGAVGMEIDCYRGHKACTYHHQYSPFSSFSQVSLFSGAWWKRDRGVMVSGIDRVDDDDTGMRMMMRS